MKISKIEKVKSFQYKVDFIPTFIERIFKVQPKSIEYQDTGNTFLCGGGHVYITKDGEQLSPWNEVGLAIDNFRRRW